MRLHVVLHDAPSGGVPDPEVELRRNVPLLSRQSIPADGRGIILRDTIAPVVPDCEVVLRSGVATRSQRTQFVGRQVGDQLLRVEALTGTERTDADQDDGKGDYATVSDVDSGYAADGPFANSLWATRPSRTYDSRLVSTPRQPDLAAVG